MLNYIDKNRENVFLNLQFRNKRMPDGTMRGQTRDNIMYNNVLKRI